VNIRSIRVADWRCFLDDIEVGLFEGGLNIIYAPNGTGKSTLFEALKHALLDGHKVTGKDVEAIRPWGRNLAPKVTVEFIHDGQEYRVTKQFLDSPGALLERKENGRYRRMAEGASADEQTREILTKNPPLKGLAKTPNWGIAQVLWAPQGGLAIGPLTGDVVSDIRRMLSAQASNGGTGPVEKRIEERYLQFFSVKGKLRTGKEAPPFTRLREQIEETIAAQQKAYDLYIGFEEASRRVEDLRARRTQVRYNADETMKALRNARAVAEVYRTLVAERNQRSERVNSAEAQYKEVKQRIDLIKSTEKDLGEAGGKMTGLESEVPLKDREVQEREKEAASRKAELEDARKGREAVDKAVQMADAARRFNGCSRELRRVDELISKIEKAEKALTDWRKKRNAHVAPDARALKVIRKAIKDRDDAQLRIEASLITLEIVPHKDGLVEVVSGETTGPTPLKAGVPTQVHGSPEVVAEIPHVARLRTWGPVGSVEEHREARAKADKKLRDLTDPFGTSDLDTLESLAEKGKELDASVAEADTKLQTLLAGHKLDDFVKERNALETTHKSFLGTYPDWGKTAPGTDTLDSDAEDAKRAFITRVENAEAAWDKARSALTAVSGQKETLSQRLEDAKRQVTTLREKLAELTSDGKSLEEHESELLRNTMAWEAARARLVEIQDQLSQCGDDPVAVVERLEAQFEATNRESNQAREQEVREEARLEGLSAQGPYSALATMEEKVAQLQQEVRREELRVEAIRLLHDTVAACRSEAIAAVSMPVEAMATKTLQRIAGRRLGRIQVSETFEPSTVVPESMQEAVTLDNLSGGEQEQLYLATRLALAEVLGKEERQLVVLDDVLTATDTGRLARIMNVLEEAAQRLQILILTCHPERYRGLKRAAFFDLESLIASATSSNQRH
jgi:DNA repair exonuclease SbcCD ATPase subunit